MKTGMKKQIFQQLSLNENQFVRSLGGKENECVFVVAEDDGKLRKKKK